MCLNSEGFIFSAGDEVKHLQNHRDGLRHVEQLIFPLNLFLVLQCIKPVEEQSVLYCD